MNDAQLNDLFLEFWEDSYPNVKPGVHAISTHVAFARQALDVAELMKFVELPAPDLQPTMHALRSVVPPTDFEPDNDDD